VDPLTHTLVGASLASTRLGKTTRFATVTLVVGTNLPDLDVLSYFAGGDAALGFRRGWTHGALALAILPALFALALWLWSHFRPATKPTASLSPIWLFGLSYLAILTHPVLDWLNTYGMRWLMPFDGTWFYGDAVFIMDPWIWLLLGGGCLIGRAPTRGLLVTTVLLALPLITMVWRRAPDFLPIVAFVAALLVVALLFDPGAARISAARAAALGLILAAVFIVVMVRMQRLTESHLRGSLAAGGVPIEDLMVGPLPARPWAWEFVVQSNARLRHGTLSWLEGGAVRFSEFDRPAAQSSDIWPQVLASGQQEEFLDWARFPWLETDSDGGRVWVMDARYARRRTDGFGAAAFELPARATQ
jgi:inner membrane protein